jgi:hypothetical protein
MKARGFFSRFASSAENRGRRLIDRAAQRGYFFGSAPSVRGFD